MPIVYKFLDDYQKERIEAFLHPENLSLSGNYQVWQSKVAMGSGGFFGKGLFQGTQKSLDFIPVQQSDFIFSVVVEELGFLGGTLTILVYAFLLIRFTRIIRDSVDLYGALIVIGFLGMFLFQIFENIAMTMGLMPLRESLALPFRRRHLRHRQHDRCRHHCQRRRQQQGHQFLNKTNANTQNQTACTVMLRGGSRGTISPCGDRRSIRCRLLLCP